MAIKLRNTLLALFFLATIQGFAHIRPLISGDIPIHGNHNEKCVLTENLQQHSTIEFLNFLSDALGGTGKHHTGQKTTELNLGADPEGCSADLSSNFSHVSFCYRNYSLVRYFIPDIDSDYLRLMAPVRFEYCSDFLYSIRRIQL